MFVMNQHDLATMNKGCQVVFLRGFKNLRENEGEEVFSDACAQVLKLLEEADKKYNIFEVSVDDDKKVNVSLKKNIKIARVTYEMDLYRKMSIIKITNRKVCSDDAMESIRIVCEDYGKDKWDCDYFVASFLVCDDFVYPLTIKDKTRL